MSKFKPNHRSTLRERDDEAPAARLAAKTAARLFTKPTLPKPVTAARPNSAESQQVAGIAEEPGGAFQQLGFYSVLLFVFFRFSFAHEFVAAKLHFNTHIIIILGILSYLSCILSGQMFRALQQKSTWMWIGFTCFMGLATATSFWRGGSIPLLSDFLQTGFPVIFVIPAVVVTRGQITKMMGVIGLACIATVLLGTLNSDFKTGRMGIDAIGSDIQDPNDYAAHLILMMPALTYLTLRSGRAIVMKLIGVAVLGLCFLQILSTGSRGALVSLAITSLYIAFIGSKRVKLGILVGIPVLAMLVIPFVPADSITRLSTIFSASASAKDAEAADSSQARLALLQASWKATAEHPLLGVGPGIFMDYQANSAQGNGQRGMWHVTHNSYTQVSSECGIPALAMYLGALGLTLFSLKKCSKAGDRELASVALFMSVMIVGFCVCIIFLSLAYSVHILVLSALTVSLKLRLLADDKLAAERVGAPYESPEAVPA